MSRRLAPFALGELRVEVLPDGRVLMTLPAACAPFGATVSGSVLYPSLHVFLRGCGFG